MPNTLNATLNNEPDPRNATVYVTQIVTNIPFPASALLNLLSVTAIEGNPPLTTVNSVTLAIGTRKVFLTYQLDNSVLSVWFIAERSASDPGGLPNLREADFTDGINLTVETGPGTTFSWGLQTVAISASPPPSIV